MKWLIHKHIFFRAVAALAGGVFIIFLAWSIAYFLLPEGALSGATLASRLPIGNQGSLGSIFLKIFLYNLLIAGGASAAINLIRVGNLPLGYIYVWGNWALYGLFLGTNSFEIPHTITPGPSLITLLNSSGFYEIGAYTLIAASTINLYQYRQVSWTEWRTERVRAWKDIHFKRWEIAAILLAVMILVGANLQEAVNIFVK
jgi:hypothetical protein